MEVVVVVSAQNIMHFWEELNAVSGCPGAQKVAPLETGRPSLGPTCQKYGPVAVEASAPSHTL
jgi:hypothetical protein